MKKIAATPALCALLSAIYQILRDHSAHLKRLELEQRQQSFNLGVSSHMAQIAFDKHIEFCEKYIAEVHEASNTLFREGPTEEAFKHERNCCNLRIKYSTWITDDISKELIYFENQLCRVAQKARRSEKTKNPEIADKAYLEADRAWEQLLGQLIDQCR